MSLALEIPHHMTQNLALSTNLGHFLEMKVSGEFLEIGKAGYKGGNSLHNTQGAWLALEPLSAEGETPGRISPTLLLVSVPMSCYGSGSGGWLQGPDPPRQLATRQLWE